MGVSPGMIAINRKIRAARSDRMIPELLLRAAGLVAEI